MIGEPIEGALIEARPRTGPSTTDLTLVRPMMGYKIEWTTTNDGTVTAE